MISLSRSRIADISTFIQGEHKVPRWVQVLIWVVPALLLAKITLTGGLVWPLLIAVLFIAIPIALSALWNTEIGVYILLSFAFFMSIPNRLMEGMPLGILIDLMILLMLTGMIYRCAYTRNWTPFRTPISAAILLWAGMNLAELVNPVAASRASWFYVVRPAVGYMMLFFLTYHAISTPRKMFRLLYVVLALCLFSACWGIWQANYGYFGWEYNYVVRHDLVHLVFNYGRWRAIGTIGSPAQFGIIMGFVSVYSIALLPISKNFFARCFIVTVAVASLMGMVYSGTRSAYVIIPIFYFGWVILSRNRKLYYSLSLGAGLIFLIATVPTQNYHIQRIQSTFKASEDASYQVRARNKKIIFPWILKHPIGGGLGSTGIWGQRFSPGTFLANFPPDSGLIRVAVELGWIGLCIFLYIYYTVLVKGTALLWKMTTPKYKAIVSATICGVAPLLVVEWGQEVVGVFPMSMLFWIFLAIMFRAIYFDKEERENTTAV